MLEDEKSDSISVVWFEKVLTVAIKKRSIHLISIKINPENNLLSNPTEIFTILHNGVTEAY